jgi:hypothetical protein
MDEQTIFTLLESPVVAHLTFDDPLVLQLAIVFGVGALSIIAALALAAFFRRRGK